MIGVDEITQKLINSRKLGSLDCDFSVKDYENISINDAYKIQKDIISGMNVSVSGWKLGGTNKKTRELLNVDELFWGPVFDGHILTNSNDISLNSGEVEIAVKINKNIQDLDRDIHSNELSKYIDSVALSIEYPKSFIANFLDIGIEALISDCCGSGQCLIGNEIAFLKFCDKLFMVEINSVMTEKLTTDTLIDGLYQTTCDFINKSSKMGYELKGGQWIFTGGLSKCISYKKGTHIKIKSKDLNLEFTTRS